MQKGFCILAIVILFGLIPNSHAAARIDDIRILIDVSGSMKKTDPSNLRVAAAKLLNGLIPTHSKAGVWTFGRYVDMTVKWGTVNDRWRKAADLGATKIHSNALFTNIERGLVRATRGWEKPDPNTRRSLILLTDGQVDISSNADKNQKSRDIILSKSVQALKKSGVRVHAIALSKDSDEVLLKQLALTTGGSFEVAESAEDLQRIFFRTFERATVPDTVKLTGNQFSIDKSIKEMTLLIFRKKHSAPTVLYPPKSSPLSLKKPGRSAWRSESGYDLITIKKPKSGVWNIDAEIDSDNRLMVVTDLKLKVGEIPAYLMPGQPLGIVAELYNKETKISKNSFLRFVDFKAGHTGIDDEEEITELKHSSVRADKGQYLYAVEKGLEEGTHSFVISADSRTFNRSKRFNIEVQWPVEVKLNPTQEPGNYSLSIQPREEYLKPASLRPTVTLLAVDGSKQDLEPVQVSNGWRTKIETSQDGMYQAIIKIEAVSVLDKPLNLDLGSFPVIGVFKPGNQDEVGNQVSTGETNLSGSESNPLAEIENAEEQADAPDWVRISIAIVAANLLMITAVAGVWFLVRRKKSEPEISIDLADEDV